MQSQINYCVHSKRQVYYAERITPRKFRFKTGQLVKLLAKNPNGLSRKELILFFCKNFESASMVKRESVKMSVEKIIQRARETFKENRLTIIFDKTDKRYVLRALS